MKTFNRHTTISFIAATLLSTTAATTVLVTASFSHAAHADNVLGSAPPVCAKGFTPKLINNNPQHGYKCVSKKLKCNAGLSVIKTDYIKNRNKFVYICGKIAG